MKFKLQDHKKQFGADNVKKKHRTWAPLTTSSYLYNFEE
jgi:hypothetical protein